MATIRPFCALRPSSELAAQVSAPPYDVVSLQEARTLAEGNPLSFLRVSRAELELEDGVDPYDPQVYQHGADNLQALMARGVLARERTPVLGVYRQVWRSHSQTGIVALASVEEYDRGVIKKHEYTRPVKEADRVNVITAHQSQSGPVLLFFRSREDVAQWMQRVTETPPDVRFTADDGVEHVVWSVKDEDMIRQAVDAFQSIPALYIADGHHRSAAASRVHAAKSAPLEADKGFLSVVFPHDELRILPYNRVVRDLHGLSAAEFHSRLEEHFHLAETTDPGTPPAAGFDVYVNGRWSRATPKHDPRSVTPPDPVRALAVSELSERVLAPVLGIHDQRSDPRIDFVGGVRGPKELAARVDGGEWAAAFWLYPTTVEELMAVSDADTVMPPKSTWFEPKLRDGLFIHLLEA